jgi:hypothetical protein
MTEEGKHVPPSTETERLEAEASSHVHRAPVQFRVTGGCADHSAEFTDDTGDDTGDDTIELALTEEEMLALSRAADEEHAKTSLDKSALSSTVGFLGDRRVRSRRWPPLLSRPVLGIVLGVALGLVANRISTVTIKAPSEATRSADPQESPVRFNNPFDASEVFEFPPGTSDDQARQSVAAVLLQRARDRLGTDAVRSDRPRPGAPADRARLARNSQPRRT